MTLRENLTADDIFKLIEQLPSSEYEKVKHGMSKPAKQKKKLKEKPPLRKGGFLKGRVWMADDFDAPLEDFKEYM